MSIFSYGSLRTYVSLELSKPKSSPSKNDIFKLTPLYFLGASPISSLSLSVSVRVCFLFKNNLDSFNFFSFFFWEDEKLRE